MSGFRLFLMAVGRLIHNDGIIALLPLQRFCWRGVLFTKLKQNTINNPLNQNIMKTLIKTLIASSLTAIVLTTSLFAGNVSALEIRPEKSISVGNIKRVYVQGNVEVLLIQSNAKGVSYTDDNTGTAKVTQDGDILRITSADGSLAKLVVYVNDIYRIDASGNAVIKTQGKLNVKYLQVFMKGNAHADLNTSTEGLYTVINENADLKLSGSTDDHTLVMSKTPKLTIDKFAALKTNISSIETLAIDKQVAAVR